MRSHPSVRPPVRLPARLPTRLPAVLVLALSLLTLSGPSWSAPDDSSAPPRAAAADPLAAARDHVRKRDWSTARRELERLNKVGDADWHNLMGFVLRKQPQADLDNAERHYNEALRIAPSHLGALEYAGELHLMKGNLAQAEGMLASLAKACSARCEEYTDLKKAVEAHKAQGERRPSQ